MAVTEVAQRTDRKRFPPAFAGLRHSRIQVEGVLSANQLDTKIRGLRHVAWQAATSGDVTAVTIVPYNASTNPNTSKVLFTTSIEAAGFVHCWSRS